MIASLCIADWYQVPRVLTIVVVTGVEVHVSIISNAADVCIERRVRCAIDGIVVTGLRACPRLDEPRARREGADNKLI